MAEEAKTRSYNQLKHSTVAELRAIRRHRRSLMHRIHRAMV